MIELQILIGLIIAGIGGWIGKGITAYINERDKFRDQIASLRGENVLLTATINAMVARDESRDATIAAQNDTITSLRFQVAALEERDVRKDTEMSEMRDTIAILQETISVLTSEKTAIEQERDEARGAEAELI
jgi:chromosome segregation ATPase